MWTIILGEPCITSCLRHHHGSLRGAKIKKKIAYTAYPCEFLCKASCAASFRKTIFESLQLIRGIQNVCPKLFKVDFRAQSAQSSKSWPNTISSSGCFATCPFNFQPIGPRLHPTCPCCGCCHVAASVLSHLLVGPGRRAVIQPIDPIEAPRSRWSSWWEVWWEGRQPSLLCSALYAACPLTKGRSTGCHDHKWRTMKDKGNTEDKPKGCWTYVPK